MNFLDKYQLILKQAEQLETLVQGLERALSYHREVAPIFQSEEFNQAELLWRGTRQRLKYLLQTPVDQHVAQLQAIEQSTADSLVQYVMDRINTPLETYRDLYYFVYHLHVVSERHPETFKETSRLTE